MSSIEADKSPASTGLPVTTAKKLDGLNPSTQDDYEQDKENQNNSYRIVPSTAAIYSAHENPLLDLKNEVM